MFHDTLRVSQALLLLSLDQMRVTNYDGGRKAGGSFTPKQQQHCRFQRLHSACALLQQQLLLLLLSLLLAPHVLAAGHLQQPAAAAAAATDASVVAAGVLLPWHLATHSLCCMALDLIANGDPILGQQQQSDFCQQQQQECQQQHQQQQELQLLQAVISALFTEAKLARAGLLQVQPSQCFRVMEKLDAVLAAIAQEHKQQQRGIVSEGPEVRSRPRRCLRARRAIGSKQQQQQDVVQQQQQDDQQQQQRQKGLPQQEPVQEQLQQQKVDKQQSDTLGQQQQQNNQQQLVERQHNITASSNSDSSARLLAASLGLTLGPLLCAMLGALGQQLRQQWERSPDDDLLADAMPTTVQPLPISGTP